MTGYVAGRMQVLDLHTGLLTDVGFLTRTGDRRRKRRIRWAWAA